MIDVKNEVDRSQGMNQYQHFLYKRGFVFSDSPITPPHDSWPVRQIGPYWFAYRPAI